MCAWGVGGVRAESSRSQVPEARKRVGGVERLRVGGDMGEEARAEKRAQSDDTLAEELTRTAVVPGRF